MTATTQVRHRSGFVRHYLEHVVMLPLMYVIMLRRHEYEGHTHV